ncbi:MAG: ABC transporter permease [Candidatus Sumerlaeia bacterium]
MSEQTPSQRDNKNTEPSPLPLSEETVSWRQRKWVLIFWLAVLLILFRPLIINDIQNIMDPPEIEKLEPEQGQGAMSRGEAIYVFLADLITIGICAVCVYILVVSRLGSIAYNTFREAVRNRILYFILLFAIILMGASGVVKDLAIAAHQRIVTNIGLASISFFGLMAAVFLGISLVYNELEKKTIYTIVSKPVHRYQFLLGKFFGLLMTIYVIVVVMTFFFFVVYNYQANTNAHEIDAFEESLLVRDAEGQVLRTDEGEVQLKSFPALRKAGFLLAAAGKSAVQAVGNFAGIETVVTHNLLIAIAMIMLELMIITAFAILFSSFSTPTMSAVFTVMIFLAGRMSEDILRFGNKIVEDGMKEFGVVVFENLPNAVQYKYYIARFFAMIVPNLDSINVSQAVVHTDDVSVWRYGILYCFGYTACLLMIAILVFRKRNFK